MSSTQLLGAVVLRISVSTVNIYASRLFSLFVLSMRTFSADET